MPLEASTASEANARLLLGLLAIATTILLGCFAVTAVGTRNWPLISDAVLIRYANRMLHSGMVPYRQLIDINLPGSYLVDSLATTIFGTSAAGWRAFDLALMALVIGAMAWVARRNGGILAGICTGALFALVHAADGVAQMGQRDLLVAVILLIGFAVLTGLPDRSLRHGLLFFGLCCGLAGTIKPTALLFFLVALPLLVTEWRRSKTAVGNTLSLLAGVLLPWAAMGLWLWRKGALAAFVKTATGLMRFHAAMARHPFGFLMAHALPASILPLMVPALVLLVLRGDWRRRDQQMVLIGIACGFASFCLQGKAYPYHRYPLLTFVLLLVVLEIAPALGSLSESGGGGASRSHNRCSVCSSLPMERCGLALPLSRRPCVTTGARNPR